MDTAQKPDFKIGDATSYDPHIEDFGRFSAVLTTPLARRLIAMANVSEGQRVLDVGTGTGVVALEAAKAVGHEGRCIGIDLSEKMLEAAITNARRANLTERVEFKVMDAESLQFEAASFDVVVSLFALLHFPDPATALNEMFRVLKPGGTLVVAVGSSPRWLSWLGMKNAVMLLPELISRLLRRRFVAPEFLNRLVQESIPAGDESEESSLARANRNRTRSVTTLLRNAGFENLRQHWEGHQATMKTPEDFWDIQRTFSTIARKRLNRGTSDQITKIRARFEQSCQEMLARGGQLTYPFAAFFVAARRPLPG